MIHQVLAWPNLVDAWNDVYEGRGAPGRDGVTPKRWRRHWEERLVNLRREVLANQYRPGPLKRFSVRKKSGGYRHITCLTVTDKVLQRAALNVLDALFDPTFLECSYGYRKGRSTADAVEAICAHRDAGYTWVLDADIDECFASLDHAVITELLCRHVQDAIVLRLIAQWLEQGRQRPDIARGIPLGFVISPLLCNLVLHQLDLAMTAAGYRLVRYADDFVVLCRSRREAEDARACSAEALARLKLQLEPHKTAVTHLEAGFDFLGVHFEGDHYTYLWENKRITVQGDFPDFLFAYRPRYE